MYINFWYPVCTSAELEAGQARRVELLGVRLAAFRDSKGEAHVLADTCIHRGGSLSRGKVIGDCLQCPYHGWQYNGAGACTTIPSMGERKPPARAKVDSYPVQERYGIVFAFLGDLPEGERPPLHLVEEFEQEGWQFSGPLVFEVDAYYERSIENGMDPIHNEFVHPSQGAPAVDEDRFSVQENKWGCRFEVAYGEYKDEASRQSLTESKGTDGLRAGSWHTGPNTLITGIHIPGGFSFIQYFYEAPLSNSRTRIFFVNERNNNLDPGQDDNINKMFMKVAREDQHVIENLWPKRTPDNLTRELMTPGDAAVVAYRKYLDEWDQRGWRIDTDRMQATHGDVAWAIPCPARRESGNWVLESVPLVASGKH